MSSDKPLGYPPRKHFYRTALEDAWNAAIGALDLGDFDTFLRESADLSFEEALKKIEVMGDKKESVRIREGKLAEKEGGIEQYREIADELRQSGDDYRASAIESLISELIAERNKPKTKRATRAKPAPKPPTKLETFEKIHIAVPEHKGMPASFEFGKDYKRVQELIFRDGEENIKKAKELLVTGSGADLTDEDRKDLSSLLSDVEAGFTPAKEPTISEIHKKKVTKIRKATDIEHKEEEEEEEERRDEKEGELEPFRVVQYETDKLNMTNAIRFLEQHRRHIPAILKEGIKAWLNKHPEVYVFPVNTRNVDTLSTAFARHVQTIEPKNLREQAAIEYIQVGAYELVSKGVEQAVGASPYLDMRWEYYTNTLKTKLPDRTQFKRDVVEAIKNLSY